MAEKSPPEPDPDGWKRFERAVDVALHTAPKHRESKGKAAVKAADELKPMRQPIAADEPASEDKT